MPKNQESFNQNLYSLLKTRGYNPIPIDSKGKNTRVSQDADVFKFDFIKGGENYGTVWATIDQAKKLIIYYDDDITNSPDDNTSGTPFSDSWTSLLKHLKNWAQRRQLSFELRNRDHLASDMAQREYMKEKEKLSENYYPMGKKASYNDSIPQVKIILQHTRQIEEGEQRFRNIAKIFVENTNGERFAVPTTRPGLARVYARHVAEGGSPYDDKGKHITSLVEEFTKMAGFVRATRNKQFNESAIKLVNEGINHYNNLRETLQRMTSHRGYNNYFDAWTPVLNEQETEPTNVNELFVQETLDPRIESVLPILSKLQKNIVEVAQVDELKQWTDAVVEDSVGLNLNELSPALLSRYRQGAEADKKFNQRAIDRAISSAKTARDQGEAAEWEDEVEFLQGVNKKREKGLKRARKTNESTTEFKDGDIVRIKSPWGDGKEKFRLSQVDYDRKRAWAGDLNTDSGWYVNFNQIEPARKSKPVRKYMKDFDLGEATDLKSIPEDSDKDNGYPINVKGSRLGFKDKNKWAEAVNQHWGNRSTISQKGDNYYAQLKNGFLVAVFAVGQGGWVEKPPSKISEKQKEVEENLSPNQKKVGQVGPTEKAKKISPVLGKKEKDHPFRGRLVGASESKNYTSTLISEWDRELEDIIGLSEAVDNDYVIYVKGKPIMKFKSEAEAKITLADVKKKNPNVDIQLKMAPSAIDYDSPDIKPVN